MGTILYDPQDYICFIFVHVHEYVCMCMCVCVCMHVCVHVCVQYVLSEVVGIGSCEIIVYLALWLCNVV